MNTQGIREKYEAVEKAVLSDYAAKSYESKGRIRQEPKCPIRTEFQRDRDRIIHSKSFRRLKHKTQVFLSPERDHYRTRLTHTLEVSQIARTIARSLSLNEDLTEAVALGHDLGHTPFGHAGERALNRCHPEGFHHYRQSVRVVEKLEKSGQGLNLTFEVKDGIGKHTTLDAYTLEGRIVRLADLIAYMNHDIDDAIRAGVLKESDIPETLSKVLGKTRSERIDTMVKSVIHASGDDIALTQDIQPAFDGLHEFLFESVYRNPIAKGEEGKVEEMICRLYDYFCSHPERLSDEYLPICEEEGSRQAAVDFVAGMTDRYAIKIYQDIFIPTVWQI